MKLSLPGKRKSAEPTPPQSHKRATPDELRNYGGPKAPQASAA
jgi:hypothetical protein